MIDASRRQVARRGIALFAALGLLTLIALLIVGSAAASTLAQRSSWLARSDQLLNAAADYAVNSVLGDSRLYDLASLPFGVTRSFDIPASDASGVTTKVAVTRLRDGLLWLVADASIAGVEQGHRRINVVARFPVIGPSPTSPIVARGSVHLGAGVTFLPDTSHDVECATTSTADIIIAPGARSSGTDSVRVSIEGAAADSGTYFLVTAQLAAIDSAGVAVHVRGDTTIVGGAFDGILIVDGNLTISGAFVASGLIVARGRIDAHAVGWSLTGALLSFAAQSDSVSSVDVSSGTLRYSRCAVERALRRTLVPKRARRRSWAEFY